MKAYTEREITSHELANTSLTMEEIIEISRRGLCNKLGSFISDNLIEGKVGNSFILDKPETGGKIVKVVLNVETIEFSLNELKHIKHSLGFMRHVEGQSSFRMNKDLIDRIEIEIGGIENELKSSKNDNK